MKHTPPASLVRRLLNYEWMTDRTVAGVMEQSSALSWSCTPRKKCIYTLCVFSFFSNTGCDENTQTLLLWLTRSFIMINIDALMPTELVKVHRGAPTVCGSTHYSCLRHLHRARVAFGKKKKKTPSKALKQLVIPWVDTRIIFIELQQSSLGMWIVTITNLICELHRGPQTCDVYRYRNVITYTRP